MKVVIAPDSFKESLSAPEVANAIARGIRDALPEAEILLCPMADGGEGTVDAVLAAVGGKRLEAEVSGPLGEPTRAHWGWLENSRTAVIEVAAASGLQLIAPSRRDARITTSYGTGQLILAALEAGVERIILGLGGSATNDGGSGMLQALGARLADARGTRLAPGGSTLRELAHLDLRDLEPRLASVRFEVACDVNNPLCGPLGASRVFGPQKGAGPEAVPELDAALGHFADICAALLGRDCRHLPGSGAAGGIGFAAYAFLQAGFRPGIELIAELARLDEALEGADLVITGEGRLDGQTLHGKTPMGVAAIAARQGVPVIALAGTLGEGYQKLYEHGIEAAFSIAPGPITLETACANAAGLLRARARDLARLWQLARRDE